MSENQPEMTPERRKELRAERLRQALRIKELSGELQQMAEVNDRWFRKLLRAATEIRKIRGKIRRLEKKIEELVDEPGPA